MRAGGGHTDKTQKTDKHVQRGQKHNNVLKEYQMVSRQIKQLEEWQEKTKVEKIIFNENKSQ